MMIDVEKTMNRITNILTGILLAYSCIYEGIPGRWVISLCLAMVIYLFRSYGSVKLFCDSYVILNVLMILYVAVSSVWAWDSSITIGTARSMLIVFFITAMLYSAYKKENGSWDFMNALKWGGYFLAIYQIQHYGINRLRTMLFNAERINNELGNANGLGMTIAFSCLFEFLAIAKEKHFTISSIFLIPSIIFIAATQSRKAFLILLIGSAFIYSFYCIDRRHIFKSLIAIVAMASFVYFISAFLNESKLFSGVMKRMEGLVAGLTGEGKVDASTNVRKAMITVGWNQFMRTPILGIGINNARLVMIQTNTFEGYSHNNYIELLCGGGIFGALIYYSRYLVLIIYAIDNKYKSSEFLFPCIMMVLIVLIMDYGNVTYNVLSDQLNCVLMFLLINEGRRTKEKAGEQKYRYVKTY